MAQRPYPRYQAQFVPVPATPAPVLTTPANGPTFVNPQGERLVAGKGMYHYGQRDEAPRPALNIPRGGFGKTVKIKSQDLYVLRVLQQTGTSKVYPLLQEFGGFLELDPSGLMGIYLTNDYTEPKTGNAGLELSTAGTFISPAVSSHLVGTVPYVFHTHPSPKLSPNEYAISPIHIGDILVFYYDVMAKLVENGALVLSNEGCWAVSRVNPNAAISPKMYDDRAKIQQEETRIWSHGLNTLINRGRSDPRANWTAIPDNNTFILSYLAQRIPTVMIPELNRLYNPYNLKIAFYPVEYNRTAKTWQYPSIELEI
jgi:hypothetical protein